MWRGEAETRSPPRLMLAALTFGGSSTPHFQLYYVQTEVHKYVQHGVAVCLNAEMKDGCFLYSLKSLQRQ